jgi:uncharacterized membrane protein YjgN (DUF898 family)
MKLVKSFVIFIVGLIIYTLAKELWPGFVLLHAAIPVGMIWLTWQVWRKKPEASA